MAGDFMGRTVGVMVIGLLFSCKDFSRALGCEACYIWALPVCLCIVLHGYGVVIATMSGAVETLDLWSVRCVGRGTKLYEKSCSSSCGEVMRWYRLRNTYTRPCFLADSE